MCLVVARKWLAPAGRAPLDLERVRPYEDQMVGRGLMDVGRAVVDAAVKQIDVAEEVEDERRGRLIVDLVGRADLLDPPLVHHHDAVGHFERLFLVVGDEDAGDVQLVVQPAQPAAQLLAHLGVERAERLVEQQHARLDRQRARQRHALALAAGELRRIARGSSLRAAPAPAAR